MNAAHVTRQDPEGDSRRRFKCPLLVGFTGHRDLRPEELPAIEAAVEEVLADVSRRHPHSPLVVLTGLAEGADRLAARMALRRGIEFIAVLPLPLPLYVTDFESADSRNEFEDLLGRAAGRFQMPLPEGLAMDDVAGRGPARDSCYVDLGAFLAERSHVLVAVWDGVDNGKPGGTASVVKARTEPMARPASAGWRELLPNDVVHLVSGRVSTAPAAAPGSRSILPPPRRHGGASSTPRDEAVATRIDAFNRDVDRLGRRLAVGFADSSRHLLEGPLPPPRAGVAGILRDHFAAFDRLAIHWQNAVTRSLLGLHVLIWVAVLCFEASTNFEALGGRALRARGIHGVAGGARLPLLLRDEIFVVYFVLVGLAWAVKLWANRCRQQPRHLDYRSIAEALRIQFFWRLAGLDRGAAAEFRASQLAVCAWMRSAVATVTLMADARHPEERSAAPARTLRLVNRGLCLGQFRYFRKAAARDAARLARRRRWIAVLFLAGLAATVVLGIARFEYAALTSVAAMFFVTAGLMASHTETLALDEHVNQYAGMTLLYAAARRAVVRALRAGDLDRARGVIADAGEEALGENASWVLLHRTRPLRVPQTG